MNYKGINFENVKNNNRSAILHILNNEGAMSRKDIAKKTGLTAASVTLITTELIEEKILVELGEAVEEKRAGRRKILLDINARYKYILCISIESDETYIAVTNCKGEILKNMILPTEKRVNPEKFLEKIATESTRILWDLGISKSDVLGTAVSVPGKVDREKGISINSFSIWTKPIPIADILAEKLGLNIVVENNLKSAAESEILFGTGRGVDNFVIVKWGPGVGSAIIINQWIYEGATGLSGELGHVTLGKKGKPCNCGRTGCLETEISTHVIMDGINALYKKEGKKNMPVFDKWISDGNEMSYLNAREWAALGDDKLQELMADKIDKMAFCIRNYISLLDPNKVILTGYMFETEGVFEKFVETYREYDNQIPEDFFVKSEIPVRENHIEPLATALNEWLY